MRLLCLLSLAGVVSAAPLTSEKLQLIPGLYPKQRRELARKLQPLMGKEEGVREALLLAGVDEKVCERLESLYPGPLLVERYSHGLVLDLDGLSERQKELFRHLHPSVLAAQWSLWWQRRKLEQDAGLKENEVLRRRLLDGSSRSIREIEKRYWRVVGYALTVEQRAALHKWLPQPYQRPPNLQAHVFLAPGLTPSQASRIQALITEYGSETAADTAEIQRLQANKGMDASEKQKAIEAATDRIADVLRAVIERSHRILTPEQIRHIDALPPLLTPGERNQTANYIKQMGLRPEQMKRLEKLATEVMAKVKAEQQRTREKLGGMQNELGSDSPQAMTMTMMQQNVNATRMLAMEEAARTAVLEILDKRQVLGWVITLR
ncbi:MAG: hypothetical protein ACYTF8_06790 [Planctomycetota bacterium]|jgi:hypothetical protein